jgi:hypothetical protein
MLLLRTFVVWAWFYYNWITTKEDASWDHPNHVLLSLIATIVTQRKLKVQEVPKVVISQVYSK